MYGAVLWCDLDNERALIWCEDHADLAFYYGSAGASCEEPKLEEGDLVRFDLTELDAMRLAENIELVASEEYPFLARDLQKANVEKQSTSNTVPTNVQVSEDNNTIVPFRALSSRERYNAKLRRRSGTGT